MEQTTGRTWDALPCPGLRTDHLSREAIEDFLHRASQDRTTPTETVIENLRLRLPDGSLCNAAGLLFARTPRLHFTGIAVRCGRFRGDSPIDFLDERTADGTLFQQLEEALQFVARNTRQAIKITGRPAHEIVPEYPDAAIREAITNAICHRDYADTGQVQVRIFDSGLEVWNPGRLPHDLTVEALYTTHHSHPRNRIIADVFYRARLIEHWGTGTLRMTQACEQRGMARPEFRMTHGAFIVRFTASQVNTKPALASTTLLTERQQRILEYVHNQGFITSAEYRRVFGVSERQANYDLKALVSAGVLVITGKARSTRYVLPDIAG